MGIVTDYFKTFFSKKRYLKNTSLFSIWDKNSVIALKTYLALGVRITNSSIGEYTRIRHFCTIHFCKIGKYSAIGKNVKLGVAQHPLNLISTNVIFYQKNKIHNKWVKPITFEAYQPISIGNDVWIGEGAMVMGGVTIGNGSVVASRSVVTKDVPPYSIVGGVPAKVIKFRFDKEIIAILESSKWWDFSDEEIDKIIKVFTISNPTKKELLSFFNSLKS